MIHPLLHLIATQPQLLADHAEAYAELVGEELAKTAAFWKMRVALNVVALALIGLGALLAGVALMLWAVTPPQNVQVPWALWAGPGVPIVLAVICFLVANKTPPANAFVSVKQQLKADLRMLREVSAQ